MAIISLKAFSKPHSTYYCDECWYWWNLATLGRFFCYRDYSTQLVVVDPESSVVFDYYYSRDESLCVDASGRIEDIDRPSGRAFISSGRG